MADEPETNEDVELLASEGEEQEIEAPEGEEGEDEFSIELEGGEEEDELLTEGEDDTPLQKKLRAKLKEVIREKATTARERDDLRRAQAALLPKIEVGEEPTLESCDYDEDKFKATWRDWNKRSEAATNQEADVAKQAAARDQAFQLRAISYRSKLMALPISEAQKEEAEKVVIAALPAIIQSTIIEYMDDPAKIVVALARHPQKLQQIQNEADPIRALLLLKEMERNLKVVTRKRPPAPESDTVLRGSAPVSKTSDKREIELEKKAAASGDYDALFKYRQEKKRKAA